MKDIYTRSIDLHKKYGGKLEIKSKVPLKNHHDLSLAYTPGVAKVCLNIAKNKDLARLLTWKKNTVAIVTDGSSVLGLGNLGATAALPVMEGKAILFKELGGVDAIPICLNTQDTEEIISIVKNIAPTFGGINLEDISAPRCFEIEARLKKELDIPVMHDDQFGTAVVVLAAAINSLKLKNLKKESAKIVINGSGAAGTAIAKLFRVYGFKHLLVCDSKGIIGKHRMDLPEHKKQLAKLTNKNHLRGELKDALAGADFFIGVSVKNVLTGEMIKLMNKKPVIFALANPNPEIHPSLAKKAGAFIVATGRSDFPNQLNNVLAFPGIFRGALDNNVKIITEKMLIYAAEKLAGFKKPLPGRLLPYALDKRVVAEVAKAIRE